jgi:signal transduction histidine kinase
LSDLVYDILDVARIEQGGLNFTPQKVFPQEVIVEIIKGLEIKTKNKNLDLFFEGTKEDIYSIQINPNRFRQILTNLIENAIKYTLEGKIWVRTKRNENKKQYIIEIEDSGIGIAAEHQKRLFEKFFRVKTKETAEIPGTGLGLWLTKQMIENSKGKIFVESIKGKGTKFIIIFPLMRG